MGRILLLGLKFGDLAIFSDYAKLKSHHHRNHIHQSNIPPNTVIRQMPNISSTKISTYIVTRWVEYFCKSYLLFLMMPQLTVAMLTKSNVVNNKPVRNFIGTHNIGITLSFVV